MVRAKHGKLIKERAMKRWIILLLIGLVVLSCLSGCKDITDRFKPEGSCRVTWTDPPQYLEPGKTVSLNFSVAFESTWGVGQKNVYFDIDELSPGYATAGKIAFTTPDGTAYLSSNYNGSLESGKVIPEGRPGDSRAIYVSLGNGYGFRYSYGWKEE